MSEQHTPEPTDIHSQFNACMYRGHCKTIEKQRDELLEANRILCEDIAERHNRIAELKQQRDELLAALKPIAERGEISAKIIANAIDAIASVKSHQH